MSINKKNIVDPLMDALGCKTTRELRDLLNENENAVYRASIIRWKSRGMGKAIGAAVWALITKVNTLEKELKELKKVKCA